MFCPICQRRNQPFNNFCYYCGYQLKQFDNQNSVIKSYKYRSNNFTEDIGEKSPDGIKGEISNDSINGIKFGESLSKNITKNQYRRESNEIAIPRQNLAHKNDFFYNESEVATIHKELENKNSAQELFHESLFDEIKDKNINNELNTDILLKELEDENIYKELEDENIFKGFNEKDLFGGIANDKNPKNLNDSFEFLFENDYLFNDDYLFNEDPVYKDVDNYASHGSTIINNEKIHNNSPQKPLWRTTKSSHISKKLKSFLGSRNIPKIMLLVLSVVLISISIFFVKGFVQPSLPSSQESGQKIAVSSSVEEISRDGDKIYKITFNTANGKKIRFLDETLKVKNGKAEFIVDDFTLYDYKPILMDDGSYIVNVDAIVSSPNLPDFIEEVSIPLSPPYNLAPFELIKPSSLESELNEDVTIVAFDVSPNSELIINNQDYSDLISREGRYEKSFALSPNEKELALDIKVSTPGYLDNVQRMILKRGHGDVSLSIDNSSPIISNGQSVEISGNIDPRAELEANPDIIREISIDAETGDFTALVKAERLGYTPCILTAKVNGKESSKEIIIEGIANQRIYTSTAWEPDYDLIKRDHEIFNGRHFVFSGNIKEIISVKDKKIFIMDISKQQGKEQLVYIEFWEDFNYKVGDKIRVFGNRWGNKDDKPRFLAKYIYE